MQKRKFLFILLSSATFCAGAQDRFFTKTGKILFLSKAPLETIEAVNKTAGAVLDGKTGTVQMAVLMRGFEFKKALMQEHFNENYVESDKFPKAEFRGKVLNNESIDYTKDGTYNATASGQLTIHGIAQPVELPLTLTVDGGKLTAASVFNVLLSDYKISIPSIVKDKVSNSVKVHVEAVLEPLK